MAELCTQDKVVEGRKRGREERKRERGLFIYLFLAF